MRPVHAIVAAVGVLLIVAASWYELRHQPNPKKADAPASPVSSVSRFSEPQRQAANEAMTALLSLQSVTRAGLTYRDYAPRVLDVKVTIDRYLASHRGDDESAARAMDRAMALYVFGSTTWNASIMTVDDWPVAQNFILENRTIATELCPAAVGVWDEAVRKNNYYGEMLRLSLSRIWQCASDELDQAARALSARP